VAEAPPRVWLDQAISDWAASKRAGDPTDASTYCQIIGKQQQAVEKAVKAVLAALREKGFIGVPTPHGHAVEREVNHILNAIRRLPSSKKTTDLRQHLQNLFNDKTADEINSLCALAPKWPAPGKLFPRNTEYPFEHATNTWSAPTHVGVFNESELNRFTHLAAVVVGRAGKIVSAAER